MEPAKKDSKRIHEREKLNISEGLNSDRGHYRQPIKSKETRIGSAQGT
jgi:hypothetical protein